MEINMEVPQKIKNKTSRRSSHITSGYIPKESKSIYSRDTCTAMFITTLLTMPNYGINLGVH
jgi:hypothetical protein